MKVLCFGSTSAIAHEFLKLLNPKSSELYLVARNAEKLERDFKDLTTRGFKTFSLVADLSKLELHENWLQRIDSEFGTPDLILIAFGDLGDQSLSSRDFTQASLIITGNYLAPISLLTHYSEKMKASKIGTLVVISSVAGDRGRATNYVYGSAKAGLSEYCSGLRQALLPYDVRVITVKPGFVDTPMTQNFKKGALWARPHQVAKDIAEAVRGNRDVVYTPWFWWGIMFIIKHIPEFLFKKLKF
ncbi:MAG: SDR family oxidoreductase [Proteobacteria bacterium]|jgi:hypothetical protein|nr:SDR family oxidoreductase [Pseudomonadota bacterium]